MSEQERELHRRDVADLHVAVARRYEHAGMLFHPPRGWEEEDLRLSLEHVRRLSGMDYLITLHGDATYSIPNGNDMMDFIGQIADDPQAMKDKARQRIDDALARGERM